MLEFHTYPVLEYTEITRRSLCFRTIDLFSHYCLTVNVLTKDRNHKQGPPQLPMALVNPPPPFPTRRPTDVHERRNTSRLLLLFKKHISIIITVQKTNVGYFYSSINTSRLLLLFKKNTLLIITLQ